LDNLTHTPPPTFRTLTVSAPARLLESDRPKDWGEAEDRAVVSLEIMEPTGPAPPAERNPDLLRRLSE